MPTAIRPALRQSQDIGQKMCVDIVQLVHSKSRYVHRSFWSATRRIGSYRLCALMTQGGHENDEMTVSKGWGMPGRPEDAKMGMLLSTPIKTFASY